MTRISSSNILSRRVSSGHVEPLNVNIGKILCDLNSSFNPLHQDCVLNYDVRTVAPGQICMSVVMPDELLHSFTVLLESMSGFFRFVGNKAHASAAMVKAHDLDEIAKNEKFRDAFKLEVSSLFDGYINEGFNMKEAVKLTNSAMKVGGHPWAVYTLIDATLRRMGRLRKSPVNKRAN